jgi:phosphohistidine phosphatase SixA
MKLKAAFVVILAVMGAVSDASESKGQDKAAFAALRENGAVALMRHADAPGGAGDPPGFNLNDCSTQRNLSAKGRQQAKRIGQRLRAERVQIGKLLSSPWCRCIDTARLLGIGRVEVAATFSNAVVLQSRSASLAAGARQIIGAWKGPGTLLVVTHGVNIAALTGVQPAQGEVVVVKAEPGGKLRAIDRIPAAQTP